MGSATQNWSIKKVEIVCGPGPYKIQDPESKIENPKHKFQNPKNPTSKIPNSKSPKILKSKIQKSKKSKFKCSALLNQLSKELQSPQSEREMDRGYSFNFFFQRQCWEQNKEYPEGLIWFRLEGLIYCPFTILDLRRVQPQGAPVPDP